MVCFPFLVVLHWNELCSPITIKHPRLSFVFSNGFVKNNERILSCHSTKDTITHDFTRTIIHVRDKFLPFELFGFDDVPICVPHYVWYWPFITLVLSWLLSCFTGLLKALLDQDLAYFTKRNAMSFLVKVYFK